MPCAGGYDGSAAVAVRSDSSATPMLPRSKYSDASSVWIRARLRGSLDFSIVAPGSGLVSIDGACAVVVVVVVVWQPTRANVSAETTSLLMLPPVLESQRGAQKSCGCGRRPSRRAGRMLRRSHRRESCG